MANPKTLYQCESCGAQSPKWVGRCADCGEWNTLVESAVASTRGQRLAVEPGAHAARVYAASEVSVEAEIRHPCGIGEFDRVLGGGLVSGAVVLIGGDPGIGKSTLLLQVLTRLGESGLAPIVYVSGEESLSQVLARARRLDLPCDRLRLLAETEVERIHQLVAPEHPRAMVIDSIQTLFTGTLASAPGSVAQVRECAAGLVRYAKSTGAGLFLVGHVTKEGALAGPRVLEHMVDTVLYFESDPNSRFRLIRAVKNRFGAANELGLFAMTERGLREVSNPSAMFLSRHHSEAPGSMVTVSREGTRPLLLEVQALVDDSPLANPRRVSVGLEPNRLAMLLAVAHRHGGLATHQQDVFVNIVGGVRVTETGADLALLLAIQSSQRERALCAKTVAFGEVGLGGEVRPVANGEERLREAAKHGFTRAIIPTANAPRRAPRAIEVVPVTSLREALEQG